MKYLKATGLLITAICLITSVSAKKSSNSSYSKLSPVSTVENNRLNEIQDSLKNILAMAKDGNAEAQNEVGMWYYTGTHTERNYERALQWFARSAQQGNVEAIGNMAMCYQYGHGIARDSVTATKLYQKSIQKGNEALFDRQVELARQGSVFSNMLVASCYQNGYGVKREPKKAISFLTNAAEKGCVTAQRDVALAYLNDNHPKEAFRWFEKGAANGNPTCIFYCGKMKMEGEGTTVDKKQGIEYMLRAAQDGFPQGMFYLGNCYLNGDGVTQDDAQAFKWYKRAAANNAVHAQWALAQHYREGKKIAMNYDEALYWYAAAAENGYFNSFRKLVNDTIPNSPFVTYAKGLRAYSEKKFDEALNAFKEVEKAKIAEGKLMTAVVLLDTEYPKNDAKKAFKLLKDISKTNPEALVIMATLYQNGNGTAKSLKEAVACLEKAVEMGYGPAECALGNLYYEGLGVEQSFRKAVELYENAYEQGELTETAAQRLARCYEDGKGGLERNKEKAEQVIKSAQHPSVDTLFQFLP